MDIYFSESEKQIIRQLVNIKSIEDRTLSNYIYNDRDYTAIEWDKEFTKVTIFFKTRSAETLKTWDSLCEILFLLRKLELNNLIEIYNHNSNNKINAIFNREKYEKIEGLNQYFLNTENGGKSDTFGTVAEFYSDMGFYLEKYSSSFVYVSQSLRELVKDKFRPKEEIRHFYTLLVALTAILITIVFSLFKSNPTLESINRSNLEISIKLDSIKSNLILLNEKILKSE